MKEATGEANMAVITVILIAIVLSVGVPLIKNLVDTTKQKTECDNRGGVWVNGTCSE